MKNIVRTFLLALPAIAFSCKQSPPNGANKFSDPVLVKIYDLKDRRSSDSLYRYFSSDNEIYRSEAALAFASIQDSSAIAAVGKMLTDESKLVRASAAFAIGQMKSSSAQGLLVNALTHEKDHNVRDELIESYGRIAKHWDLLSVANDSLLTERFSWSMYRAGLRGLANSFLDSLAAIVLSRSNKPEIRLGAAHYFSRTSKGYDKQQRFIINSAFADPSAEVRMASTLALGKIKTDSSLTAIRRVLSSDEDYRVRVNAVRALRLFEFEKIQSDLTKALSDKNINASIAASELMITVATQQSSQAILQLCRKTNNVRVSANLYAAVLRTSNSKEVSEEVSRAVRETSDPYDKAALISALGYSVMSFGFVSEQLFASDIPVVTTSAANALVDINHQNNFDSGLREKFAAIYRKAVSLGDPAVIGIISSALADSTLGYKNVITDVSFLIEARQKLRLPEHIESIVPLDAAIAYLSGRPNETPRISFNHGIDWSLVKTIFKDQTASISTTKGNIIVRLFVEEAPGSVANFVSLVDRHYYDDKFFHRVVPNFVAQAGCKRGDGYGSEDYSIRSEFSRRRYKTGSLGMASAGKDTEGTQWFITHSPTPHLDGGYTIFGEVVDGIDIVHSLAVGDKILKIQLIN